MNKYNKKYTGGVLIIPSARPSIHDYRRHLSYENRNMIQNAKLRDLKISGNHCEDQGVDVVDNALSKPAYPIQPPSKWKINEPRRNSLHTNNNKQFTDDDTDVLSKSVPTTLPSQLHCSDDSDDELTPRKEQQFTGVSHPLATSNRNAGRSLSYIETPNRSDDSRNTSYYSTAQTPESYRIPKISQTRNQPSSLLITFLLGAILAVVCMNFLNKRNVPNTSLYDEFKFYTDISGLGEKYNVDDNSILQVQTGISTIFENSDTGSFMFVYNSSTNNFNLKKFNKFVDDVSSAASKYLRNDSTPRHFTAVEGTELELKEHSELISRYREDLTGSGVMLVRHVEAIPSNLAMAFHYYCDEYNPLVKKSAIFFTLNLSKCPQESKSKLSHATIEKCLANKWSGVPADSIGPLLTRVVSVVIDVTNAF